MPNIKQQLLINGDFLAITRQYPHQLPETFSHTLIHPISGQQTLMRVLDTGIISFEPGHATSNKDIVLSSAVHGNETAPIEICQQLIQEIIFGDLILTERVLFLFGNPAAINLGQRFVEENMNRLFSGAHSDGAGLVNEERKRAKVLEDVLSEFYQQGSQISPQRERLHYDLHTAIRGSKNDKFAVYPYLREREHSKEQLQFLLSCGINTILISNSPTTTFSYFSTNRFQAHGFTVELGKVKPFGENDMANFAATKQSLSRLLSGQPLMLGQYEPSKFNLFKIFKTINRTAEHFVLHFPDDAENFTDFPVDYLLATDGEIEHRVTEPGEAIIFPNADVAIGQRALLTVIPTTL
ncbi:succinylglutamate desuccinylase [Thalassotalea aquiviva]|uniref:succinylglutamate desuccinylase n=1 Tax=Thalassotalea aquiviva TaxID=3242415 RepID=UPI00352B94DC